MAKKANAVSDDTWFEDLNKKIGQEFTDLERTADGRWPAWETGVTFVDVATRVGGLPKGRIIEIAGDPSAGKSTVLQYTAAKLLKQGKKVVWLDYENSMDVLWCATLGLDVKDKGFILVNDMETLEDGLDIMRQIIAADVNKEVALIVLDSLAMAMAKETFEMKSSSDTERLNAKARLLARELPRLNTHMAKHRSETTVAFINHVRVNMDAGKYTPLEERYNTPGGKCWDHSATQRWYLQIGASLKDERINPITKETEAKKYGQVVRVHIVKNKVGERGEAGEYYFIYGRGIDNVRMDVEVAMKRGDIPKKNQSRYILPDEFTHDGKGFEGTKKDIVDYFYGHLEAHKKLKDHMVEDIEKIYRSNIESRDIGDGEIREEVLDAPGLVLSGTEE